jgi:hypothetical protein
LASYNNLRVRRCDLSSPNARGQEKPKKLGMRWKGMREEVVEGNGSKFLNFNESA